MIKEDFLNESMSLDAHKMLSIQENINNILLNIWIIILIILNHDNVN